MQPFSGRKAEEKVYYRQSGQPGGLKRETARELRSQRPIALVEEAVRGMLRLLMGWTPPPE